MEGLPLIEIFTGPQIAVAFGVYWISQNIQNEILSPDYPNINTDPSIARRIHLQRKVISTFSALIADVITYTALHPEVLEQAVQTLQK